MTKHKAPRPLGVRLASAGVAGAVAFGMSLVAFTAASAASGHGPAFTKTETIKRTHIVNSAIQLADKRTVTVTVDTTTGLRDRQPIQVSWKGAHPTGGLVGDQQSQLAADQEYPVVVMQCRGIDSTSVPVSRRVSPKTCWTHTPAERSRFDNASFPPYRLDRFAPPSGRTASVGAPHPLPAACQTIAGETQHWVPFVAADGTVYPGGFNGCAGMPPEAVNFESSLQPSNTTYGATRSDGTGSTDFVINTAESNASLGCSASVPCSLIIIPIIGISCDAEALGLPPADQPPPSEQASDFSKCSATGKYQPGQVSSGFPDSEDMAVSGDLWWSPSNWRNRLSVRLDFASADNVCDVQNHSAPVYVYGSELLVQATRQWAPEFCLNPKLFKFQHVQTGEVEAKNLLNYGAIEAAFAEHPRPDGFARPVVQAPAALSGFGIAFSIDDADGKPVTHLKLDARLLAKLLTESYASNPTVQLEYPPLSGNPVDIALDPEFQALNPDLPPYPVHSEAAATLYALSSDSDVMWALTAYINADPAARAWLNGKADPWGMVVNPNYKGINLPTASWPLLDTAEPNDLYGQNNPCMAANPVPWLPSVAAPVSSMQQISLNMQFDIANSQVVCQNPGAPAQKLVAIGREPVGQRFMMGLVALGDAARYHLSIAALQTHADASAPDKLTNSHGRTFQGPTAAGLRAGAAMFRPSDKVGTWQLSYTNLRTTAAGQHAYPGTLLISADVPTSGLPQSDAARYAKLLRFFATSGQHSGIGNGLLPPGYLPITRANGMAAMSAYTATAADAVEAQKGTVPSVTGLGGDSGSTTSSSTGSNTGGSGPGTGGGATGAGSGGSTGSGGFASQPPVGTGTGSSGSTSGSTGAAGSVGSTNPAVITGTTVALSAGVGGLALPLVVLALLVGVTAAGITWLIVSRKPAT